MHRSGSHRVHENRPLSEGSPPQGLSEARQAESFFEFLVTEPPRDRPIGGGGIHCTWGNQFIIFSIMYREDSNLSFVKTNINQSRSLENYEYCIMWNCTAEPGTFFFYSIM